MSRRLDAFEIPDKTKAYVRSTLNPFLEGIVLDLIRDQPSDPARYMYDCLRKTLHVDEELRNEIESLKSEIILKAQQAAGCSELAAETTEEYEADDEGFEEISSTLDRTRGRQAVSAEAFGEWNKQVGFVLQEATKSDSQKERLVGLLSGSFLFSSMEEADRSIVINAMEEFGVSAGTHVITEGDIGDFLFIVEQGSLECIKQGEVVKVCEAGDVFGELSLLYNAPRAASVVSVTDCVLWKLGRSTFTHIVREGASKKREKYESFLRGVPLLSKMGLYEISQIADALSCESFGPDKVIVQEGELGDAIYLLLEGTADAFKGEVFTLHYDSPGDYFGELALIRQEPRAATVKAGPEGCRVLVLDRRVLNRLVGDLEEVRVYS